MLSVLYTGYSDLWWIIDRGHPFESQPISQNSKPAVHQQQSTADEGYRGIYRELFSTMQAVIRECRWSENKSWLFLRPMIRLLVNQQNSISCIPTLYNLLSRIKSIRQIWTWGFSLKSLKSLRALRVFWVEGWEAHLPHTPSDILHWASTMSHPDKVTLN